jgi:hypothetical protein
VLSFRQAFKGGLISGTVLGLVCLLLGVVLLAMWRRSAGGKGADEKRPLDTVEYTP